MMKLTLQEELKQRKEVQEKRQENINRSLRAGSVKLKALEQSQANSSGQENFAFTEDEIITNRESPGSPASSSIDSEKNTKPLGKINKYSSIIYE